MIVEVLKDDEVKDLFVSRVMSQAKINVSLATVEEIIDTLADYVSLFNSITEFKMRVLDRELDDIFVINELVPFIQPKSVKYSASDLNSTEMLLYSDTADDEDFSYADFLNTQLRFRALFKKDLTTGMTSLGAIKKCVSLSEVVDRVAFTNVGDDSAPCITKVSYNGKPFIPIQVDLYWSKLFREFKFNANLFNPVTDYLTEIIY